jgi:hypothetical protein
VKFLYDHHNQAGSHTSQVGCDGEEAFADVDFSEPGAIDHRMGIQ